MTAGIGNAQCSHFYRQRSLHVKQVFMLLLISGPTQANTDKEIESYNSKKVRKSAANYIDILLLTFIDEWLHDNNSQHQEWLDVTSHNSGNLTVLMKEWRTSLYEWIGTVHINSTAEQMKQKSPLLTRKRENRFIRVAVQSCNITVISKCKAGLE